MKEVRFHGRGGQGAVTAAELMALAAIAEGKHALAFPSFGPERRGAPVQAFLRIDERPIRLRTQVRAPDVVVVLDPSLIGPEVIAGLKPGGAVVLNTARSIEELRRLFPVQALAVLDATRVAREVLGVPITNTVMLGALERACRLVELDSLREPLEHRFGRLGERNYQAVLRAYEETRVEDAHG